ncbi:MAG: M23 family metallopeptidase [Bdellovibrionaceae bacterium]|nr:M23 family metallopeptidase [Pseudobdellovibrionaceae bacterium]MBX3033753.1 M23 family metallopeptidase [Pseudobdellovibrionaceae bacterium]
MAFSLTIGSYQTAFGSDNAFSARSIRLGDNVVTLLRRHGFSTAERARILQLAPGLDSLMITPKMKYFVSGGSNAASLKIFDSQSDVAYVLWKKQGKSGADLVKPDFRVVQESIRGEIRGSLMGSLMARVPSNWIASRFMDAYLLEHDLERVHPGDRFELTLEKKYEGPHLIRYGEVLKVGLEIDGQMVRKEFMRFGNGGVFISAQDLLSDRPFYAPVNYLRIASLFQPDRRHPITRRVQPHLGIDFELPQGEAIYAPRKGTVVRMGRNHAAGNYVVLLHANGIETSYNHLRRLPSNLREGQLVQLGQKIAEVGCTGYCTKPHLHFTVKVRGRMVNPVKYLKMFPAHYEESLQERVARR